ncbi:DNA/RNA helicase, superfamily II [Thiovulum sp. ES]|nr:DNA/RNA helicase, superfamily II [Thiovulum sp. ES]
MNLKPYQREAVQKLDDFCSNPDEMKFLNDFPYLCFKIPTGGGKTLIASSSLKPIVQNFLNSDFHTVFWLAPSDAIVSQTLKALKNFFHPYRQILENDFRVDINPISIREALQNRFEDESLNIVVATVQSFRTSSKEGRKFFEENGNFQNLSLSQYLQNEKPVIILDESHKSNTNLSFQSLFNLNPSFVLELSATPNSIHQPKVGKFASNVIYSVSAEELKNEKMINLPIVLRTIPDYMQILKDTIEKREELEEIAKSEREYIRPISLIRAEENRNETSLNFEKIEKYLIDEFKIPKDQIAVQSGNRNDLENINLKDENCQIRFIITIDKLKEGWDCPFAYTLTTLSNMNSRTAIEQLLGRVLRNPNISDKKIFHLNRSYVFSFSETFERVANDIFETLKKDGFEKSELPRIILSENPNTNPEKLDGLFGDQFLEKMEVLKTFDLEKFHNSNLDNYVNYNFETKEASLLKAPPENILEKIEKVGLKLKREFPKQEKRVFRIPKAMYKNSLFEESFIFENFEIDREEFLKNTGFLKMKNITSTENIIDIENGKFKEIGKRNYQKSLFEKNGDFSLELIKRILQNIKIDSLSNQFIREFVSSVLRNSEIPNHLIASHEYRVAKQIENELIERVRNSKKVLFEQEVKSLFTDKEVFELSCQNYRGFENHNYRKHFCKTIEKMNSEEKEFAEKLDSSDEVKFWFKNGTDFKNSFWLQMANAKFYPDFLVKFQNGKIGVFEYKGTDRISNDDTKEKDEIGKAWANSDPNLSFQIVGKNSNF